MLNIVYYGDPVLREECEDFKQIDEEAVNLAQDMLVAMETYKGVGLAGPQIGIRKKIFVIKMGEDAKPLFFFNPEILEVSEEENIAEEGCLSLPGIWEKIIRPASIKLKYTNEKGEEKIEQIDGFLARVVQHENDHLHGRLFIDHLSLVKKRLLKKALTKIKNGEIDEEYLPEKDRI